MAATAAALVTAAALLAVCVWPAAAFVQLMGNSDIYCESEGSYCRSDSGCCAELECVPRFSRIGGGVCQRREQQQREEADEPTAAEHALPRYPAAVASGSQRSCQSDTDCSAGQCCARRSAGPRGGGGGSACSSDCTDTEVSNILADFYTRYYRRSLRDRAAPAAGAGKHGTAHKHHDSKKKKKTL